MAVGAGDRKRGMMSEAFSPVREKELLIEDRQAQRQICRLIWRIHR